MALRWSAIFPTLLIRILSKFEFGLDFCNLEKFAKFRTIEFILDKNSNYFWFERKEKLYLSGNSYKFYCNSTNDICSNNLGAKIYQEKNW